LAISSTGARDSRCVIEQVIHLADRCQVVPLLGNHEEMRLAALEGKDDLRYWLKFGGRETLDSYRASDDVKKVPAEHVRFIKSCRNYHEKVSHFFVHGYYDLTDRCTSNCGTDFAGLPCPEIRCLTAPEKSLSLVTRRRSMARYSTLAA
jgi:hypothetical protein